LISNSLEEIEEFLKGDIKKITVVVMPDFFLDRLISLNSELENFSEKLSPIVKRKGGSIDDVKQTELRGGNAINTASALAALGIKTTPIVCTNVFGLQIIKFYLKHPCINFSHIKIHKKLSITTAMEFNTQHGKANVMLRDIGSLAYFGPHHLNDKDYEVLENADYVCLFNWAGTKRFGTELAKTVFRQVKAKGKGKTYYDTADPTPNEGQIPKLIRNVLQSRYVDVLSVNENEAVLYASQLSGEVKEKQRSLSFEELAKESARILASNLTARIDLHATNFSATFTKNHYAIAPAFKVPVLRATGAGDAWNAGNILGDANKLSDEGRLTLANAVAAFYISNPKSAHPTRKQLIKFCEKLKRKTP